jgi:hypothetical protein
LTVLPPPVPFGDIVVPVPVPVPEPVPVLPDVPEPMILPPEVPPTLPVPLPAPPAPPPTPDDCAIADVARPTERTDAVMSFRSMRNLRFASWVIRQNLRLGARFPLITISFDFLDTAWVASAGFRSTLR